jgi:hypothetical protein
MQDLAKRGVIHCISCKKNCCHIKFGKKKWRFENKAKVYATRIKVTKNAKGKIVPYKRIMRLVDNLY